MARVSPGAGRLGRTALCRPTTGDAGDGGSVCSWRRAARRSTYALLIAGGLAACSRAALAEGLAGGEPVGGQERARSLLPKANVTGRRHAALRARIGSIAQPLIASNKHMGIVVGVLLEEDSLVLGFGRKEHSTREAPDGDTLLEIGSVTKVFTATLLGIMAQKGEVDLRDPVQRYLPTSVRVPTFNGKEITLNDLVTHTSGLPRLPDNLSSSSEAFSLSALRNPYASYRNEDMYAFLTGHHLAREPGSEFAYSNLGMGRLGLALSRARNSTYEASVRSLICEPLAMDDTVTTLSAEQRSRLAQGYRRHSTVGFLCIPFRARNWDFQECFAGAGALRSTANDLLKFVAANLGCVDTPLLPVFEQMHRARHKIDDDVSIGMGWLILQEEGMPGPIVWHNGGTGGYCSLVGFCKANNTGVVVLTNSSRGVDGAGLEILRALAEHDDSEAAPTGGTASTR